MISTPALVRRVCSDHGLDLLTVYDQAKRSVVYEARGTAEVLQALDVLPAELRGTFRLVGTTDGGGKGAPVFEWVCNFGNEREPVGASVAAAGPTWAEYIELREELLEQRLRAELAPVGGGPWDRLADMLPDLLPHLVPGAKVPAATAAASRGTVLVNGAPDGPTEPAAPLPPEVLRAAENVAKLYRTNPALFAQYAPALDSLVNAAPDGEK